MTNGTPSPLSDRLSPMCAIDEQIESEFDLMTLNTVQPLDYVALAEGRRNRHWSTTLSFGPPILRRPFTLTYSHQPCINLHDSPYFCVHPYVHESRLPDIKCRSNNCSNLPPSSPPPSPSKTQARTRPCTRNDSPLSTCRSSHNRSRGHEANRSLCLGSSYHMSPLKESEGDER